MDIKDLLDPEKMKELSDKTEKMKKLGIKEEIKKNKPKENFSDLQKLNQEGDMYKFRPEKF